MEALHDYCITRLTFCDRQLIRKGFELRYQGPDDTETAAADTDPLEANAKVASFALLDFGLDQVESGNRIILPVAASWLTNNAMLPVARVKNRLILMLGPDTPADPLTLQALKQVRQKGFQIALGDYRPDDPRSVLLSETDLVQLNCQQMILKEIKELHSELNRHNTAVLCSHIESWQAFEKIKAIGFDLFQGSFLSRPELLDTPRNSTNRLILIRLMSLLFDDKSSIANIETVIEQEPGLVYRLLKFVNSAAYRLPNRIDSLHQAVIYIGTETLSTLVAILVWAKDDHKAYAVLPQILTRAKACELIARARGLAPADRYFTLGFLSLLDVALDQPLPSLIQNLSLSEPMQQALLEQEGPLSDVLTLVRLWQHADWDALEHHPLFTTPELPELMLQAQQWSDQLEAVLQAG